VTAAEHPLGAPAASSARRLALPVSAGVVAVAAVQLVVLLATSTRYGFHRDELYFIVAGSHPAFGYPDQPPLVPLLSHAMDTLGPGSLFLLRLPSALAAVTTTLLAALVNREIGGGRRAQVLAAVCTATSAFALAVGHFVTTTTFDLLSTTALIWLVVRAVVRGGPSLLAAGAVVGIGVEAKPQVGLVAAVLVVSLAVLGPQQPLRSWWAAGGAVLAVMLAAPYMLWQQAHGWPQLTVAQHIAGSAEGGRIGFLPFQLVLVGPLLVPIWVAGLTAPFRRAQLRPLRFLPVAYLVLAVIYLAGNGKAYYLASFYPALLALGALPAADWATKTRKCTGLAVVTVALSGAIGALIALPLLPERDLQGSIVMAVNPDQGETVGWPRYVVAVSHAWQSIPPRERRHTAIFTVNYGEAGAIDVLGHPRGLPHAYSGHDGFAEWGIPTSNAIHALLSGYHDARDAAPAFAGCHTLATIDNGVGLQNQEQGLPLLLCRRTAPWPALWPQLTHLG
jgi:4-amino-4-deoxy-L-arabinose transferase-like glycosyltransferase